MKSKLLTTAMVLLATSASLVNASEGSSTEELKCSITHNTIMDEVIDATDKITIVENKNKGSVNQNVTQYLAYVRGYEVKITFMSESAPSVITASKEDISVTGTKSLEIKEFGTMALNVKCDQ